MLSICLAARLVAYALPSSRRARLAADPTTSRRRLVSSNRNQLTRCGMAKQGRQGDRASKAKGRGAQVSLAHPRSLARNPTVQTTLERSSQTRSAIVRICELSYCMILLSTLETRHIDQPLLRCRWCLASKRSAVDAVDEGSAFLPLSLPYSERIQNERIPHGVTPSVTCLATIGWSCHLFLRYRYF